MSFDSFNYFIFSVTDSELKRLKDAFKRSASLGGYMTRQMFIREVLGDGVPQGMADVRPQILCTSVFCMRPIGHWGWGTTGHGRCKAADIVYKCFLHETNRALGMGYHRAWQM